MTTARNIQDLIPTRRSLLSRLRSWDDQESWHDFFATYWRLIYEVALKSGLSEVEAQEVVQETVISAAKKMPGFKYDPAIGSFKGWLLLITRRRIADQVRRRKQETGASGAHPAETLNLEAAELIPDPAGCELEAIWNEEWELNLMNAATENLKRQVNPEQYQLFDLYVLKQWPVKRITSTLGVSATQVYLAKHRIAALLKKEVRKLETKLNGPQADY